MNQHRLSLGVAPTQPNLHHVPPTLKDLDPSPLRASRDHRIRMTVGPNLSTRATITLGARAPSPAHRFIRRQTTGQVNQAPLARPPLIQCRRATITLGAPAPSPAHRFIRSPTTGRVNQANTRQPAPHSMSTRQISRHAPLRKTLPAPALTGHPTPSRAMTLERP